MIENIIPDYSKYETESLIDIYTRIDRNNNPLKAKSLDDEIKKRFNLPPETEIDSKIVMSFLNTIQEKNRKGKSILNKNEEMIRQGWIAGIVVGGINFLTWLIAMLTHESVVQGMVLSIYSIIDILAIFGLSFGIYRKSRVCSFLLGSYFIVIKLYQIFSFPFPQSIFSIIGLLIIGPFLIRAIFGTYNYHKKEIIINQETV